MMQPVCDEVAGFFRGSGGNETTGTCDQELSIGVLFRYIFWKYMFI